MLYATLYDIWDSGRTFPIHQGGLGRTLAVVTVPHFDAGNSRGTKAVQVFSRLLASGHRGDTHCTSNSTTQPGMCIRTAASGL